MANSFIYGGHRHQVVAPVVIVRLVGGGSEYVWERGFLPVNSSQAHIESLLEMGMIRRIEEAPDATLVAEREGVSA